MGTGLPYGESTMATLGLPRIREEHYMSQITPRLAFATLGVLGMAVAAQASPVVYTFDGGYVEITGISDSSGSILGGSSLPEVALSSSSNVTLDPVASTLNAFSYSTAGALNGSLQGSAALSGGGSVNFNSATFSVTALESNFTGPPTAIGSTGNFSYSNTTQSFSISGGLTISGLAVTNAKGTTQTGVTYNSTFDNTNQTLGGNVSLLGTQNPDVQVTNISLGNYTIDGVNVSIDGEIVYTGAAPVPLPAGFWLLCSGLGLLALPMIRARREA
jgi:hypothetical protein